MVPVETYRDMVVDDVGDWLDQYLIAGQIYDEIVEEWGIEPCAEHVKEAWLRVCDQLADIVRGAVRALPLDEE